MNYNVNNLVKCISYKTIIYELIGTFCAHVDSHRYPRE